MNEPRAIATPCRKICVIDPVTRLCEGCGRTLDEIARWMLMTAADRDAVMRELPQRLENLTRADAFQSDGRR